MDKTRVLYVEDEPFLGKIVKESLESRKYEVFMVKDGAKVISAFESFEPHICILDVMLPNIDGFTLGKEIRKMEARMPILFLTAKTQTEDILEGFKSGGNDYLKKPFSMEELIVRMENLLALVNANGKAAEKTEYQLGEYVFHPKKYQLDLRGESRKLSHRETQLLKIFAEKTNLPIDRRMILKEIWGDDSFFNSRNLDVYVKKLRDYLKEDPNVKIVTLKGVGYHFTVD